MTTDSNKDSTHCLICNSKVGVSTRNSVRIFDAAVNVDLNKPILKTIGSILEKEIVEENAHSDVVCKKCFKLFHEYDELQNRTSEIKKEVLNNYNRTMKKITELHAEEEYNDHDYIDHDDNQLLEEFSPTPSDTKFKTDDNFNKDELTEEHLDEEYLQEIHKEEEEEEQIEMDEEHVDDPLIKVDISQNDIEVKPLQEKKKKEYNKKIKTIKEEITEPIVSRDDNTYFCLLCPDEERASGEPKQIIEHMKTVHETRLYICDICGMDFRKRNELTVHLDEHIAKEEGDFQCEVCNRIFSNLRLFRIHKRVHYPQNKSWPCETCGKRYSSKNLLDEHVNNHIGIRPYICETCGKDFASKYTFKAHVKTHEVRPRPFECLQCNKTFLSQQNLNQHEKTHLGLKEYICQQCGKAFGSQHNLEVHNIVHTGYKPYICRMCGKAFARKAEIRDHERTHTGEKPYQCEFCGATFSQRSNLQSHKRATHYNDKRYKCDDCGKGFKRRRLLDYHIKAAHTGERPYKCETCSATFVYPEHFKKHMRIHTGEKPYLCEVCGKAFNSRDNRNAHRFIHSDKKPYECLVCGMGFMRKPLLYTHMQSQGHLNDTIVVNQPRLTTDEEQVIAIPEDVQLLINDGEDLEETGLYVAELKDHVIIQEGEEPMYAEEDALDISPEENISQAQVEHIVVNNQIAFSEGDMIECKRETNEQDEQVYSYNTGDETETIVVPTTTDYKNLISNNKNKVRLVQIRIPPDSGVEGKSWLSLVQNS
ncbi:zinc finger protein 568-like [Chelonus insularis]|uniref:zinc finger protein 568-like n=1 Tax=Chelonus insularis TaxID=460826 RepID=UPI00158CE8C8|nr:zinc finger protein 568-like [Chelonus insularis]XP_034934487.1 zinc finger protein 568-like [Chelonus insularis]